MSKKIFGSKLLIFLAICTVFIWGLVSFRFFGGDKIVVRDNSTFPGLERLKKGEDVNAYVKRQLLTCAQFSKKDEKLYQCYKSVSQLLTMQFKFKEIVAAFEQSNLACHDEMHYVVNAEYRKGTSIQDIWNDCSDTCLGACYHGGLEGLIEEQGLIGQDDEAILDNLIIECKSLKKSFPTLDYQCFHGLGHAFMFLTDGDLPESLVLCDKLNNWSGTCYEGVFMENLPNVRTASHSKIYNNPDDPLYPCNILESKYQRTCYFFQTSALFTAVNGDPKKLDQACSIIPDKFEEDCYKNIAISFFDIIELDQPSIRDVCGNFSEVSRKSCYLGAVYGFVDRFPGNLEKMSGVFDYCYALETGLKDECYDMGIEIIKQFAIDVNKYDEACGRIVEEKYRMRCYN